MPGFFDRLVSRIDKIDPESLQKQMQRLARERALLETVFQSIQEGVMVLDAEGRLNYANRATERLLGFDAEKLRGHAMSRYLRELDWEHLAEMQTDAAWSHLLSREIEVTYPEHRFLSVYAVPLPDEEGQGQGVLIILRDITRDRAQEASLVEGERFNAIKLLAAGVAHEIGNPLNALNIHLELLAREIAPLPQEQREPLAELVQIARSEVSRLDAIITQFLHALRPARPQLVMANAGTLLRETLTLMRTEIENRRIEIAIANAEGLPLIPVDPAQIKQVYFNLIKNALEAMPDGGTMAISFQVGDAYLTIDFLDSGAGIAPGDFNRIFEPDHTTKSSGHGLGLMIVQRIVQEHGGQIEVSSKPRIPAPASAFFYHLPSAASARSRLRRRAPTTSPPPGELPQMSSNTTPRRPVTLIVDDDKNTREGLQRALRSKYEVRLAESAARALDLLSDGAVDVMLTDMRMPGMDGLELLRRAQALHPEVVCILLTAYGSVETAVEAMKQGAYDFLTKPVNLDHLDMLIARALRSRDMEQKNRDLERQLDSKYGFENIIGNAQAMQPVFDTIRQAAPTQATILITGASGTGKELVAHAIHRLSTRARGPFVAVHCAALSANLLESELFGHEKGAFTGADARRKGRFEMAVAARSSRRIGEIDNAIRSSCCGCSRSASSSASAAARRSAPTSV